jgi:hypothetical protein
MPPLEGLRDGRDVLGGVAAAAAGDVDQAGLGEVAEEAPHVLGLKVEAGGGERVGKARVGVAGDGRGGLLRELGQEGVHEVRAEGAVEPHGERLHVLHGAPEGLDGLRGDHGLAAAADRRGDHHRQVSVVLVEDLSDGHERGLGVERVEDGLDQQQVDAARDEGAHLLGVGRLHLVEGHHAEARVVGVGGVGERDRQRPDGACHEATPPVGAGHAVGPLAALPRGLLVDLPGERLEEGVIDDR